MRWHLYRVRHEPGFRLNAIDITLLVGVCFLSWLGRGYFSDHYLYLIPAYAGLSFFLFCNVFRIGNHIEAVWYLPFVVLSIYGLQRPGIYWPLVLGLCEPLRVALIVYRVRKGGYVGILYRKTGKDRPRTTRC